MWDFVVVFVPGWQAPWDPAEHESALTTAGTYVSAGNLFWCNLRVLNSPSVPVSAKSIELQFNYFEATGPEKLPEEVVIALEQGVGVGQFQRQQAQVNKLLSSRLLGQKAARALYFKKGSIFPFFQGRIE